MSRDNVGRHITKVNSFIHLWVKLHSQQDWNATRREKEGERRVWTSCGQSSDDIIICCCVLVSYGAVWCEWRILLNILKSRKRKRHDIKRKEKLFIFFYLTFCCVSFIWVEVVTKALFEFEWADVRGLLKICRVTFFFALMLTISKVFHWFWTNSSIAIC